MTKGEGSWWSRAECRNYDPELFFPIGRTGPAILQIEEAKQVCRQCTVRDDCLEWALENKADHGVWGGMSEDDRRALKRRRARARVRTSAAAEALSGMVTVQIPESEIEVE